MLKPAHPDDLFVKNVYKIARTISRYFDVTIHDAERIPAEGAALLVGNHALMGVDTWALLPELFEQTRRVPRGMALRSLFEVPMVGKALAHMGMVAGERDAATSLLDEGELVITYPGGMRDSIKSRRARYTLQWEGRLGFAHVALSSGAPIIPIAGVGPDDCFPILADANILPMLSVSARRLDRAPLFVPVARRVPFEFFVGEPIIPEAIELDATAKRRDEQAAELSIQVQAQMDALLARGLELRPDLARFSEQARAERRAKRTSALGLLTSRVLTKTGG